MGGQDKSICPAGTWSNQGWSSCPTCPTGIDPSCASLFGLLTDGYERRVLGKFSTSAGSTVCTQCSAGWACVSTAEWECGPGYFSPAAGQTSCSPCLPGAERSCECRSDIPLCKAHTRARPDKQHARSASRGTTRASQLILPSRVLLVTVVSHSARLPHCLAGTCAPTANSPACIGCPSGASSPVCVVT